MKRATKYLLVVLIAIVVVLFFRVAELNLEVQKLTEHISKCVTQDEFAAAKKFANARPL
jgi:hypothetical protein